MAQQAETSGMSEVGTAFDSISLDNFVPPVEEKQVEVEHLIDSQGYTQDALSR